MDTQAFHNLFLVIFNRFMLDGFNLVDNMRSFLLLLLELCLTRDGLVKKRWHYQVWGLRELLTVCIHCPIDPHVQLVKNLSLFVFQVVGDVESALDCELLGLRVRGIDQLDRR